MIPISKIVVEHREQTQEGARKPEHYRASDLGGHDCDLYVYNSMINWAQRKHKDGQLCGRLADGNVAEDATANEMRAAGIRIEKAVHGATNSFYWQAMDISGTIDGWAIYQGESVLFEHKSVSLNVFQALHTIEELKAGYWTRRWLTQIAVYMLLNETEECCLVLRHRGHLKDVQVTLGDVIDIASEAVERVQRMREHVAAEIPPEPRKWNSDVCGSCDFLHICTVEKPSVNARILEHPDMSGWLTRLTELKPASAEYNKLAEKVKRDLKLAGDFDEAAAGHWLIKRGIRQTKGYDVGPSEYPTFTWKLVGGSLVDGGAEGGDD